MTTTKRLMIAAAAALAATIGAAPVRAEVTPDQVKLAVNKAIRNVRSAQKGDGSWQDYGRAGGSTALNLLALLNAGVPESDPAIRKGIAFLNKIPNSDTYSVSLKCMVYRYADPKKHHKELAEAAKWLLDAQQDNGTWGYNKMQVRGASAAYVGDNSNTQFGVLGLHEAAKGGIVIPPEAWKRSENHFVKTQLRDGGWHYRYMGSGNMPGYGSMTCAGIASLFITGNELNVSQEAGYDAAGAARNCGNYRQNDAIAKGLTWMARNFAVDRNPGRGAAAWNMYYLYAMERVGMISGLKFFGSHDWYRRGAEYLVDTQRDDGSWPSNPVDTAFGLLFLAKGDKPVLINKLQWSRGDEWCPDRHDVEHLVTFLTDAKNEKAAPFTDQSLGWQTVNLRAPMADLLDAPILYFNGHEFPRFSPAERDKIKEVVDQGGTILVEACCSRKEFADGFRRFAKEAWPEYALDRLPDDHPIFTAFYNLGKNEWNLEGIQVGCRTSVIFAPKDLSCLWEQWTGKLEPTETAFRIGANIAAYATGLERLKDKLQRARVVEREHGVEQPGDIVRGALAIGALAHSTNPMENMTDPNALPKFHAYLRDQAKISVVTQLQVIEPADPELLNHPIMYMTGHNGFTYSQEQLAAIRTWLDRGGFLLADSCCGRDNVNYNLPGDRELTNDFGASFRKFVEQLYADTPEAKLAELPADHPIRGGARGYFPLEQVTYRAEIQKKLQAADPAKAHALHVEGVTVDGRLVIVYSRYALTCGLEDHKCFNCRGLVSADAYRLATNAVLYALSN